MVPAFLLSLSFTLLWAFTIASPLRIAKEDSPIRVVLSPTAENAVVEVAITNIGLEVLSLLKHGSILSKSPIQRLDVSTEDGTPLEFLGIRANYDLSSLTPNDYITLLPGATIKDIISLAPIYDLSSTTTSTYRVVAAGTFQAASFLSTAPDTLIEFASTTLNLAISAPAAALIETVASALEKRVVAASCTGSRRTALDGALSRTVTQARAAAEAARSGDAEKFKEYFNTTNSDARGNVARRLSAIADAAETMNSGGVRYYCSDPYENCAERVLAWTIPSRNIVANCDIYYSSIPADARARSCHGQDQWTTTLHELTHAPAIYAPATRDYAYGYEASVQLDSARAINNADTYALYAQSVYKDC